ncbi:OmpA family protein [Hoeflea sp. WL0058]|uniref:OmpA family protein n=1 Tax=Flavimaribacter sediminis TaxID=2865987 RepID=A0AAE3D404_9HYPH|nr:OmpA family protein [Flavimaribacter sediminis]MBW8640283.1 OmpA family protein [Flavimaribacter sediminis]
MIKLATRFGLALAAAIMFASVVPTLAQSPSAADIIKALRPKAPDKITSSRSPDGLFNERGIDAEDEEEVPSIDIRVNFALDSIKLENETLLTLRALGNALASNELSNQDIEIVGHTDGRGSDEYNDRLSKRRAAAVVAFILENFEVDRDHIKSEGRGEQELLYPEDPENDLNRRVEIRNVTALE